MHNLFVDKFFHKIIEVVMVTIQANSSMVTIQTNSSAGQIIPCTEKFLNNLCRDLNHHLHKKKKMSFEDYELELLFEKADRLLKMPVCEPNYRGGVIKLGNAAKIIIDKRPPVFILFDGAVVLKKELPPELKILNFNCPLGAALKHKKKLESGNFKEKGKIFKFTILDILPYHEAKQLFFPKEIMQVA